MQVGVFQNCLTLFHREAATLDAGRRASRPGCKSMSVLLDRVGPCAGLVTANTIALSGRGASTAGTRPAEARCRTARHFTLAPSVACRRARLGRTQGAAWGPLARN